MKRWAVAIGLAAATGCAVLRTAGPGVAVRVDAKRAEVAVYVYSADSPVSDTNQGKTTTATADVPVR